jgi:hypothetical protein
MHTSKSRMFLHLTQNQQQRKRIQADKRAV